MDLRKTPLVTNEYYHIFNRGVARMPIFLERSDYQQALSSLQYYNQISPPMKFSRYKELPLNERSNVVNNIKDTDKLTEIISYVLMPNHLHLELKQIMENGISIFMNRFANSYTKYFNIKNDRVGSLFQGSFKSVHIETEEQLLHVSRYIHLNPLTSYIVTEKDFLSYPWSSLKDYLRGDSSIVNLKTILHEFSSTEKYLKFVLDQKDYQRRLKQIEHLAIEK